MFLTFLSYVEFLFIIFIVVISAVLGVRYITKVKHKTTLIPKDPEDLSLTDSSTEWVSEQRCPFCLNLSNHSQVMAKVCNKCGSYVNWHYVSFMSWRKIYDGSKWIYQFRYGKNIRFTSETFNHDVPDSIKKIHK